MKKGSYLDCLVTRNKISPPWIIALAISIPLKKKKKLTPNYMRINIPGKIKTSGSSYYFCSEYKQATLLNNQAHSLQLRSTLSRLKPLITYLLLLFLFLGHRHYLGQIITCRSHSPLQLSKCSNTQSQLVMPWEGSLQSAYTSVPCLLIFSLLNTFSGV